ncbi:MAG: acetyltransferase [Rhodobacteraceae bacterium]|nr:acetyltransferase [Paracoccaceae bacterium]MBR25623.1 acetyltransferase [Paracoccaceae bacterium]
MPAPFLDAAARHPLRLPDGTVHANTVHLARVIDHPNIAVGDFSYAHDFEPVTDWAARLAPYLHPGAPERLVIGRFAQVAHGVRFVTASANHPRRGISTYPFGIFQTEVATDWAALAGPHPDTVIGDDCWLGHGATVLPGARLGSGVVVSAGAVVRGEVPAFAIVAGNPGRVVAMRFPPEAAAGLEAIRWWDRPTPWIEAHRALIEGGDIAALARAADGAGWAPGLESPFAMRAGGGMTRPGARPSERTTP